MMVASVNRTRKETHKKALVVLLRHDGSHGIHGEAVIMIRGEAEVLKLDLTTESILVGKNRSCASTTSRSFIKRDACMLRSPWPFLDHGLIVTESKKNHSKSNRAADDRRSPRLSRA